MEGVEYSANIFALSPFFEPLADIILSKIDNLISTSFVPNNQIA